MKRNERDRAGRIAPASRTRPSVFFPVLLTALLVSLAVTPFSALFTKTLAAAPAVPEDGRAPASGGARSRKGIAARIPAPGGTPFPVPAARPAPSRAVDPAIAAVLKNLPAESPYGESFEAGDWLLDGSAYRAVIVRGARAPDREIVMTNGLVSRTFRLAPNGACTAFDDSMTGASLIRGVKPEARLVLDGETYDVGGLVGQEEYAYLRPKWIDSFTADPKAFRLTGIETGATKARFPWKRKRYSAEGAWPPPGKALALFFAPPPGRLPGLSVAVRYEIYDGLPLVAKWLVIRNGTKKTVRLDSFTSEILAAVEAESCVGPAGRWRLPGIHVESDYAFHGMTPGSACRTTFWVPDPKYLTQVNYRRQSPVQLESRPPIGPDALIPPGGAFETFRTFELVFDSTGRERQGLAVRRMYRTLAPWATENPILMHVRRADPESVKSAVDQCAAVGFEMVIMTFGSGFNPENEDPSYIAQVKELAAYAHKKGIELGGYSLLASRRISEADDVINPKTGKRGGAIFGNSPCLCSRWGEEYFRKITAFFEKTDLDVLEHDGSYPGDVCASQSHPGHRGLEDSQWAQWKKITGFYKWCRGRGIYLNVPDWYFLCGSNKTGMGYRESNWSLPRPRQIILGRQNIYDGTWYKTPSMGWMFVPLVQYHGGGAAATLEPLCEHLPSYGAHLAQNFGSGVQACYRGPRLYDTEETKALVKGWVAFYKKHRAILDSDVIHVRRPDCRDIDCILHVNAKAGEKGLAMVYNPLGHAVKRKLRLPLYYTGLERTATVREKDGRPFSCLLDRKYVITVPVEIGPEDLTWFVID